MNQVLLLNSGFEPLRIVSWQRAFVLVFQEKVEILEEYRAVINTVRAEFKVPAVIKLRRWVNLKRQSPIIRFSRANVYARDEYKCQYCYKKFSDKDLTLDHVKPVVRGGKKTWENIVAACIRCNQKKGHRTPEEAGLRIFKQPRVPHWIPGMVHSIKTKSAPAIWGPYLTLHFIKMSEVLQPISE